MTSERQGCESCHGGVHQEQHEQEAGHRDCDVHRERDCWSLTLSIARDPPEYRENWGNQNCGELAGKCQASDRSRGPEPSGPASFEEPPEEVEHGGGAGDQRELHGHERGMGEQIGALCEKPGRECHSAGPIAATAPERGECESDEPYPDGAETSQGQELLLAADRVVDQVAMASAIE